MKVGDLIDNLDYFHDINRFLSFCIRWLADMLVWFFELLCLTVICTMYAPFFFLENLL